MKKVIEVNEVIEQMEKWGWRVFEYIDKCLLFYRADTNNDLEYITFRTKMGNKKRK